MIKRIGTEARNDLEKFFGIKVFLDLRVKVKPRLARQRPRPRRHRRAEDGDQAVEGVAPFEETKNLTDGPEHQRWHNSERCGTASRRLRASCWA